MLTAHQRIARNVHRTFVTSEKLIDQASVQVAVCQSTMQMAAGELEVPIGVGLRALQKVSEANALLVRARQLMIEAHPLMKKIPAQIGLEEGYGHVEETPTTATKFEAPAEPVERLKLAS